MMKKLLIILVTLIVASYLYADGGFTGDKVRAATNNTWVGSTTPPTVYIGDWFEGEIWLWYQNDPGLGAQFVYTIDNWSNTNYDSFERGTVSGDNARYSNEGSAIGPWDAGTTVKYKIQCWHDWYDPDFYTTEANFTVNALNDPSNLSITNNETNPNTQLDLSWNQDAQSHSALIVRKAGSAVTWGPSQGTNYNDWANLGDNTVVVRGSEGGTSITDDNNDSGLDPNTTYHYKIYSENFQYYSSGITGDQQTLPVELSTFTAQYLNSKPTLYWTTQSETDNMGWFVYRNQVEDFTSATKVSRMIEGHGTTTQAQSYIYEDVIANPQVDDVYYYWLESIDYSGTIHHFDKVAMITIPETNDPNPNVTTPQVYDLLASPNPFNETTNIKFMLTQTAFVDVAIYDVKGALVKSFDTKHVTAEVPVSLQWNGKDENGKSLSNGIYLYSVKVNGQDYATKQVILMK